MPRGAGTLAEKLVKEFEDIQRNRPYETYGVGARRAANELLTRSKAHKRKFGTPQSLQDFTADELRLAMTNQDFAKEILKEYDPRYNEIEPNRATVRDFMGFIKTNKGAALFPDPEHQPSLLGNVFFNPEQQQIIKREHQAKIDERTKLGQQGQTILSQSNRLAPLSSLHTTAKDLIQRNNPTESLRLGRQEITAAGNENIPRAIDPYLQQSSQPMNEYIQRYEANYQPLINNFRAEARRDFLENDLPRINTQYASRGAFHGNAREKALDKARRDKEERIEREVARLKVQARQEAEKNFHVERGHHLKQAEVAGHAHQAERSGRLQGAEALRVNNLSEQAALNQQAIALSQMGRTEQEQAQRELDVRLQEHEREMQRPYEQQMMKAQIAAGNPQPHFQFSPTSVNPGVPSGYTALSGAIGQMAGLAGQPQQQQQRVYAQGGHVRRGYAAGDSVSRAAAQLQEMAKHNQESPEEAEMRNSAQAFKNHHANPMADYLFALGSHQLANLSESPMKTYGEGSQLGMQAYKQAQASNLSAQEKYNNLMGKINDTKMNMRGFLAKHHQSMLQQEEMLRHHHAQEGESKRAHDMMQEHHKANQEESKNKLDLMRELAMNKSNKPIKKTSTQEKLEEKALDGIIENQEMRNDLGLMEDSLKQSFLGTGPRLGPVKSFFGIDNDIDALGNHIVTKANKLYGRGAGSNAQLKTIQGGKPGQTLSKKANETVIKKYGQEAERKINKNITYLLKAGWSPKDIETATGVKPPKDILARLGISEEQEESETQESPMQTEQGNDPFSQWLAPQQQEGQ